MHSALSAYLAERLIDRAHGHRRRVIARLGELLALERGGTTAGHQDRLLADLLTAAQRVPFYRERLGRGRIDPGVARAALAELPVVARADIQPDVRRFVAEDAGDLVDDATGGSTGTPLVFKVDRETQIAREASLWWANCLTGWRRGERIGMLWGSDRDVAASRRDWRLDLRWRIENMRWYNAFDMGEDRLARFHEDLQRFRPHLLVAYAGSVFTLARHLESRGLKPDYPLRGIVSSAEVITAPMRAQVERVFGRPVFDRYGNRESGAIAAECPHHQGLHVNEADFLVEIESADPHRIPGRVLVTYLRNRSMPLIRYDTGDVARWWADEPCACGRTWRRLAPVEGRMSDTIRTAGGRLIHGEYFTHVLYGSKAVREFQFVQDTLTDYRLLLVADPAQARPQEAHWREEIGRLLGPESRLAIEYVPEIAVRPSGKRKFTLTHVKD